MEWQAAVQAVLTSTHLDPTWVGILVGSGFGTAVLGFAFKINRSMARMEAYMEAHAELDDARFLGVARKFEGVDRQQDGLRGAVQEIGEKIAGMADVVVGRVQEIVSRLETRLEDTNGRIDRHLEEK